jgi:NAD(P)-dependent dehydrogenase (short-subunit alcohol dehydrogenase family)
MFNLSQKVALITGGAGLLGEMHSEAIVENGGKVIVSDVNLEASQKVCDKINNRYPNKAFPIYLNVLDKESITDVLLTYPEINVLINNAAIDPKVKNDSGPGGSFELMEESEWNISIDVIMKGTFLCSQVFCPHFAKNGGGNVINISSVMGVIAPNQGIYGNYRKPITYSAAKHGIIGMTKYLATYYAESNVRVNALSPGGVFDNHPEEFVDKLTNLIPMGRMANKNEYKGSIVFLCSDASSYMTGQNLIVDGGMTTW